MSKIQSAWSFQNRKLKLLGQHYGWNLDGGAFVKNSVDGVPELLTVCRDYFSA